ncbi:collagen alpha-3(VI) chain-like isoform X2 [Mya arenaria]|uniref:collagen alpha-3(VI) chain-like isoform X2 n=1 Tax=Mya arenaria TaxID=6604 RepID=UPI0022DF2B32|nr:collagen alpha-3(VI) chain-like isoform X2 [Mya arenaria]
MDILTLDCFILVVVSLYVSIWSEQRIVREKRGAALNNCYHKCANKNDKLCHYDEDIGYFCLHCDHGWKGNHCDEDVCTPHKDADIVFLVDTSWSANTVGNVKSTKLYIQDFISHFPIGPDHFQFSLVTFAFEQQVVFYLNSHMDNASMLQAVEDAMESITCEGSTMVDKALDFVASEIFVEGNGARNEVERYVFVLTDGLFSKPLQSRKSAYLLHTQTKAQIYAIATGNVIQPKGLLDISSSNRHVYPIGMQDSIQTVLKQTMFGCEGCKRKGSDITLLFDTSSEISIEDFDTLLKAGEFVISNTDLSDGNSDIRIATFGEDYIPITRFRENRQQGNLMQILNTAVHRTSETKHLNASYLVHETMKYFDDSSGRRNVIIFFTEALNLHVDIDAIKKVVNGRNVVLVAVGPGLNSNYDGLFG